MCVGEAALPVMVPCYDMEVPNTGSPGAHLALHWQTLAWIAIGKGGKCTFPYPQGEQADGFV